MMFKPTHPGVLVREECLDPLGLTAEQAADALAISVQELLELMDGRSDVTPELAVRLEKVFGSTAETWLRTQASYDVWVARQRADQIKVKRTYVTPVG